MLLALLSMSFLESPIRNEIEVAVSVQVVSSQEIAKLPSVSPLSVLTRQNIPSQPIERSARRILIDGTRTQTDIAKLNSIEDIEVLRGPEGTLYGSRLNSGLQKAISGFESTYLIPMTFNPSANLQPNGWTRWTLGSSYKDLIGDTQVFNVAYNGSGSPTRTLLGRHPIYLGTYLLPDEPKSEFLPDSQPNENLFNQVGGIRFKPEFAEQLGTSMIFLPQTTAQPGTALSTNPLNYIKDCTTTYGQVTVDNWIKGSGLGMNQISNMLLGGAAQGEGMNRLSFPGDPMLLGNPDCGSDMSFPPGTTWIPDRPGYQSMTNYTPLSYSFEPQLSVDGSVMVAEMRTHCLNIELKEPERGVRYFPYAPSSPVLGALCRLTERSLVRGPWDQARTWIFTDKAGLADINKRISPEIGPDRYLSGLWDVVRHGGFSAKDMLNKKVMDPALLLVADAKPDAFGWLSAHLSEAFAKELTSFIGSNAELAKLLSSSAPEDRKHSGRLARSLLASRSPEVRTAFLGLLLKSDNGLKGQVGDLRQSLYSADSKEVELALQASEKLQTERPTEAINYLAEHGANDGIKAKARGLR